MRSVRVFRFEVPDRAALERLAALPLPGSTPARSRLTAFREIFYDTPAGDLRARGATARLRIYPDGRARFMVQLLEAGPHTAGAHRNSQAYVENGDAAAVLAGDSEPARLLRALIDPAQLEVAFEIQTLRRKRNGRLDATSRFTLACETHTVGYGTISGELYGAELRLAEDTTSGSGALELLHTLRSVRGVRPALTDTAGRARALLEALEVDAATHALRAAREVAVVPHRAGEIGVIRSESAGIVLPVGPGHGPEACRRLLRSLLGHGQGRVRLLGTSPGFALRPALDVWLAEGLPDPGPSGNGLVWVPLEHLIEMAGSPVLRDARTLGALNVLTRAGVTGASTTPTPAEGQKARVEPIETLLRRLEVPEPAGPRPRDLQHELFFNAELSRLAFDERILTVVEDPATPLLDRVRFLAMFAARRDDFFATRVARFKRALAEGDEHHTPDGLTPTQQLDVIAIRARNVMKKAQQLLRQRLIPDLETHGIVLVRWSELSRQECQHLRAAFGARLEALLTPIVADPAHPFPHLRNLRPALAAVMRLPGEHVEHLVAIEFPGDLPRFLPLAEEGRFVCMEDMIEAELPRLYPGLELVHAHTFRVTRSAEIVLDTDAPDVLRAVEHEVRRRQFGEVVRLEVEEAMPPSIRDRLLWELQYETEDARATLSERDVYQTDRLVDLAALEELTHVDRPELKWPPIERRPPFGRAEGTIFDIIRDGDRLVHFPAERFEDSVERLFLEAAEDDNVISIKTALYRTSRESAIVRALRRARDRGKETVVLLELKASFDELRNIEWARELEDAGIRVVFSSIRYKVHAKIALVVRREGEELRRYAYIGTGNLNATTAASYVDLGLLTAQPALTAEVAGVFNLLTGYAVETDFPHLLVAPFNMRRRFLQLIARESEHARQGRAAGIRVQLNGLADRRIIAALYDASQAGVPMRLNVREICALRPGLSGASENIEVRSLLGRFLQHARIFHFTNGGEDEYYIGSADWRPRNLSERIEVVTPVSSSTHKQKLDGILEETFHHADAWRLTPDGLFERTGNVIASIRAEG